MTTDGLKNNRRIEEEEDQQNQNPLVGNGDAKSTSDVSFPNTILNGSLFGSGFDALLLLDTSINNERAKKGYQKMFGYFRYCLIAMPITIAYKMMMQTFFIVTNLLVQKTNLDLFFCTN